MTYRVESKEDDYFIIEKDTDLVIGWYDTEEEAREVCRALNLGAGFNGFTPTFFTLEYEQKERQPNE